MSLAHAAAAPPFLAQGKGANLHSSTFSDALRCIALRCVALRVCVRACVHVCVPGVCVCVRVRACACACACA
eukprot:3291360-Alexandrium_andersonii.AAC.1